MNTLVIRSIAGIIFSVVVIGSAVLGPWALGAVFLVFGSIALREFYRLVHRDQANALLMPGMLVGAMIYMDLFLVAGGHVPASTLLILLPVFVLIMTAQLFARRESTAPDLALMVLGWIYVMLPFGLIHVLAYVNGSFDHALPVGFFLILWTNDSGAYFVGRFLGRTKLYEAVSPNKTWEGLAGGIALSVLVAWGLSHYFPAVTSGEWMAIAAIIAVFANVGDLFESLLKRIYGVKDSGNVMPGHGGMLDRFDGLLFSIPVVIAYLYLFR